MGRYRLWLLLGIAFSIASCPGCTNTGAPPLSTSDQAKKMEASRQAEMNLKADQINRSNLPADQKQRLLEQLRAGSGK